MKIPLTKVQHNIITSCNIRLKKLIIWTITAVDKKIIYICCCASFISSTSLLLTELDNVSRKTWHGSEMSWAASRRATGDRCLSNVVSSMESILLLSITETWKAKVGLHQRLVLNPLVFMAVMDVLTCSLIKIKDVFVCKVCERAGDGDDINI